MQADPIKPALKAPGSKHLNPKYDEPLFNFAFNFNFNLRRCIQGPPGTGKTRIILSLLSVILHAHPGAKSGHEAGAHTRPRFGST